MGVISFIDGLMGGSGGETTGITFWSAETTKKYVEQQIEGQEFKTINGESIKGEGNIEIDIPDMDEYYTKTEADETFMKKGEIPEDVATKDDIEEAVEAEKQRSEDTYMKKGEMPTDVYTKAETDEAIEDAIDSQKFKTIGGESIIGEGDIEVEVPVATKTTLGTVKGGMYVYPDANGALQTSADKYLINQLGDLISYHLDGTPTSGIVYTSGAEDLNDTNTQYIKSVELFDTDMQPIAISTPKVIENTLEQRDVLTGAYNKYVGDIKVNKAQLGQILVCTFRSNRWYYYCFNWSTVPQIGNINLSLYQLSYNADRDTARAQALASGSFKAIDFSVLDTSGDISITVADKSSPRVQFAQGAMGAVIMYYSVALVKKVDSFKTINGESILGEGDIEIGGAEYEAGEHIKIEDDVISTTGLQETIKVGENELYTGVGGSGVWERDYSTPTWSCEIRCGARRSVDQSRLYKDKNSDIWCCDTAAKGQFLNGDTTLYFGFSGSDAYHIEAESIETGVWYKMVKGYSANLIPTNIDLTETGNVYPIFVKRDTMEVMVSNAQQSGDTYNYVAGETLVSYKTINGESIIGEGNIEIHGGDDKPTFVLHINEYWDAFDEDDQFNALKALLDEDYMADFNLAVNCNTDENKGEYVVVARFNRVMTEWDEEAQTDVITGWYYEFNVSDGESSLFCRIDSNGDNSINIIQFISNDSLGWQVNDKINSGEIPFKTINGEEIYGEGNIEVGENSYIAWLDDETKTAENVKTYNAIKNGIAESVFINESGNLIPTVAMENGDDYLLEATFINFDGADGDTGELINTQVQVAVVVLTSEGSLNLVGQKTLYYDDLVTKDGLKTINGQSILGDGDIEIKAGGESDHITDGTNTINADRTFVSAGDPYAEAYRQFYFAGAGFTFTYNDITREWESDSPAISNLKRTANGWSLEGDTSSAAIDTTSIVFNGVGVSLEAVTTSGKIGGGSNSGKLVGSEDVFKIKKITKDDYNALSSKDANTLYIII